MEMSSFLQGRLTEAFKAAVEKVLIFLYLWLSISFNSMGLFVGNYSI